MLFMKNPSPSFSWSTFLAVFYYEYWIVLFVSVTFGVFAVFRNAQLWSDIRSKLFVLDK